MPNPTPDELTEVYTELELQTAFLDKMARPGSHERLRQQREEQAAKSKFQPGAKVRYHYTDETFTGHVVAAEGPSYIQVHIDDGPLAGQEVVCHEDYLTEIK
jgi:hypothetical protein